MKTRIYFILLALIGSIFYSCNSDDLEYQNEFETSKKVWLDFKESANNSYKYTVVNGSWVGFSSETTIRVENGEITQRHFEYTSTEGLSEDIPENELSWTETETEIGSHENGGEPLTIDEIYNRAEEDWLIGRRNTTTYFESENNGIISSCGYVEDNCADDCFIGIDINNIEAL
jgi:hypothetical protein